MKKLLFSCRGLALLLFLFAGFQKDSGHFANSDRFVLVPAGTFVMGGWNRGAYYSTRAVQIQFPSHKVSLDAFYLSKYEVTRGEFAEFARSHGSENKEFQNCKNYARDDSHPVICISWYDAVEYCNWRSEKDGLKPVYQINREWKTNGAIYKYREVFWDMEADGYRLPTEAEWEYAARSGGKQETFSGLADPPKDQAPPHLYNWTLHAEKFRAFGVFLPDDFHSELKRNASTQPVGSKLPNGLGIYDMTGNALEWCWDHHEAYHNKPQKNPTGANDPQAHRALRGGSFMDQPNMLPTTWRNYSVVNQPDERYEGAGFRLARGALRK